MKDIQVDAINKNKPQGKTVPVAPVYFTGEEEKEPIKTPSINQEFPKPPNEFDIIKEDISKGNIPIELIPKPKPIEYNLKANSGGLEFQETTRKSSDVARFYQNKKETIENNTNDFNQKLLNEMYSSGAINISPDGSIEYDTQKGQKLLNDYAKFFTETHPAYKKYFVKFAAPYAGSLISLNDLGGVPIVGMLIDLIKDEQLDDNVVAFDRSYKQISNMLRQFDNWNKTYGKARGTNKININDMDTAELVGATLFDSIKKFASGLTMGATEFLGDIDPTGLGAAVFSPIHSDVKDGIRELTRLTQQYPDIYKEEAQGLEALNKGLYKEGWIGLEAAGNISDLTGAMRGAGGFKLAAGMIEKLSAKLSPLLAEKAIETTQRVTPKIMQMIADGKLESSMAAIAHRESMVANTLNIFKKVFGGGANFAGMKVPGMNMTFGSLPKYTTTIAVSSMVNNLVKYNPSMTEEEIIENFRDMAILGVLNYGAGALMSKVGQSLSLVNAGLKGLKIPPQELIAKQTRNAILGMGLGNIAAGTPATLVSTYISTGKLLPEQDEFMNKYSPLGENHVLLMDACLNAVFGFNEFANVHSFNRHLKSIKDTRKYINDYTEIVKKETPLGEDFNKPNYEPLKLNQGGNKETTQKEYDWSKGLWQDVTRRESTFYEVAKKNAADPDNIKVDDLISTYNKIKKQDVTSMSNDIFNKVLDSIRDYTIKETPEDNPNKVSVDTKNKILFLDNNVNHSITDSNWYDENMILRSVTPEERVARTILHEGMHALTADAYEQGLKETKSPNSAFAKAMNNEYDRFVKKYFDIEQSNGELTPKDSYKNLDKASKQAIDYIVKQGDHSTQVKEFMAMITDPIKSNEVIRNSIRDDSKGTSVFSKVQERIDKLFGIDKSLEKYYDKLNELEVGKDVNEDILGISDNEYQKRLEIINNEISDIRPMRLNDIDTFFNKYPLYKKLSPESQKNLLDIEVQYDRDMYPEITSSSFDKLYPIIKELLVDKIIKNKDREYWNLFEQDIIKNKKSWYNVFADFVGKKSISDTSNKSHYEAGMEVIDNAISEIASSLMSTIDKDNNIYNRLIEYNKKFEKLLDQAKYEESGNDLLAMPEIDDERVKYVDMGKFSREDRATGTPADIEMRKVADGFIGEFASMEDSSSLKSKIEITNKRLIGQPVTMFEGKYQTTGEIISSAQFMSGKERDIHLGFGVKGRNGKIYGYHPDATKNLYPYEIQFDNDISDHIETGKVIMLARNKELSTKELTNRTKEQIQEAHQSGAEFVVGNSYIDKPFIDYLDEIGAKYTIYGHRGRQGGDIIPEQKQTNELQSIEAIKDEETYQTIPDDIKTSPEGYNEEIKQTFKNSLWRGQEGNPAINDGDLVMVPTYDSLFKSEGKSFATDLGLAESYGLRYSTNPYIIEIDKDYLDTIYPLDVKGGTKSYGKRVFGDPDEERIITDSNIIIPKGHFQVHRRTNIDLSNKSTNELIEIMRISVDEDDLAEGLRWGESGENYQTTSDVYYDAVEKELLKRGLTEEELKYLPNAFVVIDHINYALNIDYNQNLTDEDYNKYYTKHNEIINRYKNDNTTRQEFIKTSLKSYKEEKPSILEDIVSYPDDNSVDITKYKPIEDEDVNNSDNIIQSMADDRVFNLERLLSFNRGELKNYIANTPQSKIKTDILNNLRLLKSNKDFAEYYHIESYDNERIADIVARTIKHKKPVNNYVLHFSNDNLSAISLYRKDRLGNFYVPQIENPSDYFSSYINDLPNQSITNNAKQFLAHIFQDPDSINLIAGIETDNQYSPYSRSIPDDYLQDDKMYVNALLNGYYLMPDSKHLFVQPLSPSLSKLIKDYAFNGKDMQNVKFNGQNIQMTAKDRFNKILDNLTEDRFWKSLDSDSVFDYDYQTRKLVMEKGEMSIPLYQLIDLEKVNNLLQKNTSDFGIKDIIKDSKANYLTDAKLSKELAMAGNIFFNNVLPKFKKYITDFDNQQRDLYFYKNDKPKEGIAHFQKLLNTYIYGDSFDSAQSFPFSTIDKAKKSVTKYQGVFKTNNVGFSDIEDVCSALKIDINDKENLDNNLKQEMLYYNPKDNSVYMKHTNFDIAEMSRLGIDVALSNLGTGDIMDNEKATDGTGFLTQRTNWTRILAKSDNANCFQSRYYENNEFGHLTFKGVFENIGSNQLAIPLLDKLNKAGVLLVSTKSLSKGKNVKKLRFVTNLDNDNIRFGINKENNPVIVETKAGTNPDGSPQYKRLPVNEEDAILKEYWVNKLNGILPAWSVSNINLTGKNSFKVIGSDKKAKIDKFTSQLANVPGSADIINNINNMEKNNKNIRTQYARDLAAVHRAITDIMQNKPLTTDLFNSASKGFVELVTRLKADDDVNFDKFGITYSNFAEFVNRSYNTETGHVIPSELAKLAFIPDFIFNQWHNSSIDTQIKNMVKQEMNDYIMNRYSHSGIHSKLSNGIGKKYTFDLLLNKTNSPLKDNPELKQQFYDQYFDANGSLKAYTNGVILSRDVFDSYKNHIKQYNRNHSDKLPELEVGSKIIVSFMPADTMQEFMGGVLVGIDDYRTCSINAATATKICGKDYDGDGITIAMPSETMSLNDYNEIHKYLSDSQLYNKPKTELEGLLKRQLEIDELGNSVLGSEVGIPTELKYYKAHLSKEKIGNIAKLRTIPGVAWRNIIEAMIRDGKFNASREVYESIVSHNTNNSVDNYNQNTFNKDLFLQKALFKQLLDGKVVKGIFEAYNSLRKQAKAKNSNLFDLLKASVYDKTQAKDIIKDLSQIRTDYFPKDAEKNKLLFQKKVFNSTFGEPKTDYLKEGGLLANVYTQIFFAESKRGSLIGDFSPRLYKNMDNEFTRARIAGLGTYINFLYNNNCLKNFSDYQILGEPFNPIRYANGKIILPNGTNYNINQLFTSNGMFANKEIASLFYNGELTHKQLENLFDIKKKFFYNDKLDLLKSMLINAVKQFQEPNKIAGELLTEMNTAKRSDAFYRDIMTKGENINDYPNMYNLFLIANEMEDNGISPLIDGITWKDKFDSAIREHTNLSSGYLAMPEFTAIINSNIVSFKPKEIVKNLRDDAGKLPSSLKSFITKPLPQWTQSNLDTFMRDAVLPIIDNYKSYLPKHLSDAEKDKIIEDMISKYSPDSDNYILKEFAKNPNLEGKSKYQEIAMQMRTAQMLTDLERAFIPNAKYSKKKAMINPFSKAYVERLWKDFTTNPIICSKDEVILKSSKGEYTLRDIIDPSTMTQKEIHKLPFMQRYLFEPLKLMQDKIFASTTQVGEINANYSQTREAVMKSGGKDNIDSLKDYAGKFLPFQKDVANELTELAEMIIYWKEQLDNNKDLQELAFGNNYTTTFDKVYEDFIALRDILLDDRGADRLGRKFIYSEENVEALYSAVNEIKEQGYKNYIKPMQDAWQSIEKMGEDYQFIEKRIDENGKEVISNRKNEIKRIYAQVNQFINKEVRENSTYYRNEDGTWIEDSVYNAVLSKTNDLVSNFFNPEGNYGGSPVYMKDGQEYIFTLDDANKLVDKIVNDYAGEKGLFYRSQEVSPTRIYYDKMKELVEKYNYKFKTNIFGDNSEMFSKEFHLLTQEEKRILGNIAKHTILNSVNSYIDGLKVKVKQKQVLNSENGVSEGKIKDLVSLEQEITERVPFEDIAEMFLIDPNNPNPNIMTMDYRNVLDTIQTKLTKGVQDIEGACRFIYSMKPEHSDLNNLVMDLFSASTSNFYTSINKQDLELNGNGSYDGTNGIYTGDLLNIQHYNNRGQAIDSYGYIVGKVDRPVYDNKDNLIDKIPTIILVRQPNKDTNYEYSIQYINVNDISGALKGRSDTWTMKRKNEAFRDGIGANSDEFLKALVEDKSFAIKKATINYHLADEADEYGYYPRNVNYSGAMSSDVTAEYFNMIDKIDKPYKRNFMEKMDYFQTWRNYLGGKGIMQFFKGMGELVYGTGTGYIPLMALGVANMFHGVVHPSVRYRNAWMNNSLGANTGGFRYSPFEPLGKTLSILWKGLEASAEGDTVTADERMKIGAAVKKSFTGRYGIYDDLTKDIKNEKIKDALSHAVHVLKSKENNKKVEEVKQLFKQIAIETSKIDPETGQAVGFNILPEFRTLLNKYKIDLVPILKDAKIDPSMYAVKYNNEILSEAELIERIRLADVMTDMLYTKDKIMKSESDSYDNSIRNAHSLIAKFDNLSNAKMSLQLKTEIAKYLTDISIGKFNNKPSYMSNSPMYKYFTKFRPYSYFKTIDLVLGVPEQIGYYKDLLSKMENDKEFLARYEKITGGILPLQDWFLAKPSAKMTNAAITVVTDLIVHGGFKIITSWLMQSVASTSMGLIASGALNQEFIEDLSDSGFVPDVFSTMLMSMVFFMEMLRFRDTNKKDLTKGDRVLESASRRSVEKGVGTLLGAGSQMVMQQIIGGIYYSGGMADKLDYSAKKSMEDRNKYVITNTIPGVTEAIEANTEYTKAQEYEAKQNKTKGSSGSSSTKSKSGTKKVRTIKKTTRKNRNNKKSRR